MNDLGRQQAFSLPVIRARPTLSAPPRVRAVYGVVYDYTGVTAKQLMDQRGQSYVRNVRHLAVWLMRNAFGYSLCETARRIGGRDHSTIFHSQRRFIKLCHNRDYHNLAHACLVTLRQRLEIAP
jgi:chromosomal replication initiation ATPase DnaA